MKNFFYSNLHFTSWTIILFFLFSFLGNAQDVQIQIIGGAAVSNGDVISISSGNAINFRITNIAGNCGNMEISDIEIVNTTDFTLSNDPVPKKIKPESCKGGTKNVDFTITNISGNCGASTDINIEVKNDPTFIFTFTINGTPEINLLGGSPSSDIIDGSTTTTAVNGTYFGIVDEGATITRNYVIANTGSCPLEIYNVTASATDVLPRYDFTVEPYILLPIVSPPYFAATPFTASIPSGGYAILPVTFTAPSGVSGTLTSTISISNDANTTFTFDVSAEMFDFNIPGPGGITADFRLWLKSTRGVTKDGNNKVSNWADIGTNGKDASQAVLANRPTYIDSTASNINFNPVIEFENDGSTISQYLYNTDNGFYSQDIFIVMASDVDVTSTSGMTIFSGSIADILSPEGYVDDADDVTSVGLGDYTTNLTGERLWYNQGSSTTNEYYALPGSTSRTYSTASIINVGNKTVTVSDGMRILYNSIDDAVASAQTITTFENVGSIDTGPDPDVILGTPYEIGKNRNASLGNLNGRVAEIFTFAERVSDADRQKIESYLAIKYGITLGTSTEAQKDYINSFGTSVWDITANAGYNYHVAGIGKDSISDLNQKQSKTLNVANEVTIGLNGIFTANSSNTNEFNEDGDFLVWGSNDAAYSASMDPPNAITIASGITTSATRILRQWKIVESKEDVNGDVENVYVSIPSAAFSSFTLSTDEEYVLIVADNDTFYDADIIDVIPLKSDAEGNLLTWYDFDGTKYFTFGKAPKLSENHSIGIGSTDYLVGEYALNLNINDFTISAWVKADATQTSTRTIMSKGSKLQLRLNSSHQIEVMVDDDVTPRFTSTMALTDDKWHQISFVYDSGTIFLYVDGVLDKSELNVDAPSPNFNNFSLGALYIDKNNISNPFLGKIDEVYVWDQGLTEEQVRYLMNQEIERFDISGTDYVNGKILPQASSSNEVASIPWSQLRGYYDFNSFYGSTVEGLTDNANFLRLKYLDKDKTVIETQTAPLPYVSENDGAWNSGATWSDGTDQVIPNSLSLDGSTIVDWNIVQISHDITSEDRDISLLGLIQTAGTLTIADPVVTFPVEDNAGQALTISHYLELDGVIDLVGESQLIQTEGSIVDADSGGYIERDQQGTANAYNYNYWSSSVGPIGGNVSTRGTGVSNSNSNHTISGVLNDGTLSDFYQSLTYISSYNGSDTPPPPGAAQTISRVWLHKFYGAADNYYAWQKITETSSLLAGEGFTMKGTSASVSISTLQNYVFKGLPNNGDISLPLDKSSGDVERLIGNPYPSAIDATEFILDNMSIADGGNNASGTIFNGALYFWDHFGEENSHILRDYVGGYATRNLTGGTAAISNDININNTSNAGAPAIGTKVPGQYIPVNQGFFVSTVLDGFNNDDGVPIATVDGGNILFKNSQRVYATEDGSTSLFFKSSLKKGNTVANNNNKKGTPTIRLMYDSPLGNHREIIIGTNDRASNDFDLGYDAFMVDVNQEDMYWMLDDNEFVIQGVNSFNESQEFPLGVKVEQAGLAKIKLKALENISTDMVLYIKDNLTNQTHKITNEAFEMYLNAGTYNDRFLLVFRENTESGLTLVEENDFSNDVTMYYDSETSALKVTTLTDNTNILSLQVNGLTGQKIKYVTANSKNVTVPMSVNSGVYIVKCHTEKGIVNKQILIN